MRKITVTVAAVVVLVALGTAGWSQGIFYGVWEEPGPEQGSMPSWYGSTGLIVTPTALTCPLHQVQAYWHQLEFDVKNQTIYGANVGLTENLEVGVAHFTDIPSRAPGPITFTDESILNVKYQLDVGTLFDNPLAPDMALGVWDWANELNRVYYLVLSTQVPMVGETTTRQMNVHVGFANNDRDSGPMDGIFCGVDLVPFEGGLLQLEYDGDDINGALRFYPARWISLDAGVVSDDLGWGVSLNTGF